MVDSGARLCTGAHREAKLTIPTHSPHRARSLDRPDLSQSCLSMPFRGSHLPAVQADLSSGHERNAQPIFSSVPIRDLHSSAEAQASGKILESSKAVREQSKAKC
jgi:hypothetical protein